MTIVLESGWRRVELIDSSEFDSTSKPSARLGRISLRRYLTDPLVMSSMRRFLSVPSESPWLHNDHAVLDEIERLVDVGVLRMIETARRPTPIQMKPATGSAPPPKPVRTPAPTPAVTAAPTPVAPEVTSLAKQQCSNPSCQGAFENAAANGTPLIEADAPGC